MNDSLVGFRVGVRLSGLRLLGPCLLRLSGTPTVEFARLEPVQAVVLRAVRQVRRAVVRVQDPRGAAGGGGEAGAARVRERVQRRNVFFAAKSGGACRDVTSDPPPRRSEVQVQARVSEPSRGHEFVIKVQLGERVAERGVGQVAPEDVRAEKKRRRRRRRKRRASIHPRRRVCLFSQKVVRRVVRTPDGRSRVHPDCVYIVEAELSAERRVAQIEDVAARQRLPPRLHEERAAELVHGHAGGALGDAVQDAPRLVRAVEVAAGSPYHRGASGERGRDGG